MQTFFLVLRLSYMKHVFSEALQNSRRLFLIQWAVTEMGFRSIVKFFGITGLWNIALLEQLSVPKNIGMLNIYGCINASVYKGNNCCWYIQLCTQTSLSTRCRYSIKTKKKIKEKDLIARFIHICLNIGPWEVQSKHAMTGDNCTD